MEQIQKNFNKKKSGFKKTTILVIIVLWAFTAFSFMLHTERKREIEEERLILSHQLEQLNKDMARAEAALLNIQKNDEAIYRKVLAAKSMPISIRNAGFGGADYYKKYKGSLNSKELISTAKRIDILSRQLEVQSKSFDQLIHLVEEREIKIAHIPSILPLKKDDLEKFAAPYGIRRHPILNFKRMHNGIDLVAEKGAKVFATGAGTVIQASYNGGFGKCVKIDHGYGYITVYAHLSKIKVKRGQKVDRYDLIGLVGNTGLSTGPHLHYEVRINKKAVDPESFFQLQ